ncbi:MAG: hypothetical protein ACH0QD_00055 [Tepidibacillus sp.]
MLVFREIEELAAEVKSKIATLGDESDLPFEARRLQLLMRLVSYVNGYGWLRQEKIREKVRFFLRSRYNYRAVAEKFGLPLSRVHKTVSYASERLRRRIGGVLSLIRSGNLDDAERELAMVTGAVDPSSLFVRGILERFKPVKDTGVDLAACQREISFLSYFSTRNIERVVGKVDARKVNHVLYVLLTGDATYPERGILARCILDGEFDASEAIKRINDEFIYSVPSEQSG